MRLKVQRKDRRKGLRGKNEDNDKDRRGSKRAACFTHSKKGPKRRQSFEDGLMANFEKSAQLSASKDRHRFTRNTVLAEADGKAFQCD